MNLSQLFQRKTGYITQCSLYFVQKSDFFFLRLYNDVPESIVADKRWVCNSFHFALCYKLRLLLLNIRWYIWVSRVPDISWICDSVKLSFWKSLLLQLTIICGSSWVNCFREKISILSKRLMFYYHCEYYIKLQTGISESTVSFKADISLSTVHICFKWWLLRPVVRW